MTPLAGTTGLNRQVGMSNNANTGIIYLGANVSSTDGHNVITANVTQASNTTFAPWAAGTTKKIAGSSTTNLFRSAVSGTPNFGGDDISGNFDATMVNLAISRAGSYHVPNSHILAFAMLPRVFSSAELVVMTS
jgi:hypothetical protein